MRGQAALLLVVFLATIFTETITTTLRTEETSTNTDQTTPTNKVTSKKSKTLEYVKPFTNPRNILLQEIRTLNEDAENEQMQEEIGRTIKAEAKKSKVTPWSDVKFNVSSTNVYNSLENDDLKNLLEAEDMTLGNNNDDIDDENNEDDDDDEDEDEDEDDYDEDEDNDDLVDEEEVMTDCPEYCGCVGQYTLSTTARCTKLLDTQNFGPSIGHLQIVYAGDIQLKPYALRSLGLQQLESIKFLDTRITELDKTAFEGLTYLFSVNITRAGLQEIDPDIFQNNTRLNLLSITGNYLKYQIGKSKYYLLNAPSVTELDFSDNSLTQLPRMAFMKMPNLVYINLKKNKLSSLDRITFKSLNALVELDVSDNQLSVFPMKFFDGLELQTLRISDNNFTTLDVIDSPKLMVLEASNNRIKHITKEDLSGVPSLDQLIIRSNGLNRIHQHAFSNLDQLTYLDISDNAITSLTEHHLRTNSRLQILLMNNNPELESLPVFKSNTQEHGTYSVYRFECSNCGLAFLEEKTFEAMPALTRLNLSKNQLTNLPKGLLQSLSSLRELDLSGNLISRLENYMFYGATSLTKLNLAGNPLISLQVTPFLMTPSLLRLDVSRCSLMRVWSEARLPLKNLRFLSVHGNCLKRITVEELRATPKLSGLDLTNNPLVCDEDFNAAMEWLNKHGVIPKQTLNSSADYNYNYETISQWSDLGKKVCDFVNEGPPSRPEPKKLSTQLHIESSTVPFIEKESVYDGLLDYGQDNIGDGIIAWTASNQDEEYGEYSLDITYRPWYTGILWPVVTVIFVVLAILMLVAHFVVCLSKRKRHGPVIRTPMILRQGFTDNKNCGLVYKPLQEEIATPHMPKRGSFYSSSTFHYDKIVPESV